jgi:hypothetical protein
MGKRRTSKGVVRDSTATGAGIGPVTAAMNAVGLTGEKEAELRAIWGSEKIGAASKGNQQRAPARRRRGRNTGDDDDDGEIGSDAGSVASDLSVDSARRHGAGDSASDAKGSKGK